MNGGRHATDNRATKDTEVLIKLLVADNTCALNASRAQGSLTHKDARTTEPRNLEGVGGMNISRH